jgi:hypothetical protein
MGLAANPGFNAVISDSPAVRLDGAVTHVSIVFAPPTGKRQA